MHTQQNWRDHFEMRVDAFPALAHQAREATQDACVTIAALAFERANPGAPWGDPQRGVILDLREGDYSDEALDWYEEGREAVALFACLWYGIMLGLDARGALSESDQLAGEALLPGFMLEDMPIIEAALADSSRG